MSDPSPRNVTPNSSVACMKLECIWQVDDSLLCLIS